MFPPFHLVCLDDWSIPNCAARCQPAAQLAAGSVQVDEEAAGHVVVEPALPGLGRPRRDEVPLIRRVGSDAFAELGAVDGHAVVASERGGETEEPERRRLHLLLRALLDSN